MFSFGKPSRNKFAKQLMDAIRQVDSSQQLQYDAENFRLVRLDKEGELNLSNLYHEHCSLPRKERASHLERLASIFNSSHSELPASADDARSHFRPKIWNRATFEMMELRRQLEGGESLDIPLYPLGSHLYSSIVFDTDAAMRTISHKELEEWGMTYYQALEIACQNLEETTVAFASLGDHLYSSMSGDNYDSSRVLLLDRIRSFSVGGQHIATVPQRDAMYIAGSEDETSLKLLFDLTAKATEDEPRPLSPLPLQLIDGEWVDWVPPRNHVLRKRFDDLELRFLGNLYNEQQELLAALMEQTEDSPFVASFSALQNPETEELRSYCVWGEGVDSFLPRTQLVIFSGNDGVLASGEWAHVADVVGDLMVPDERYYPTRYRVREFPSTAQLAEIGIMEL